MPEPMIHNAGELEALAQRMGLLPFFACGMFDHLLFCKKYGDGIFCRPRIGSSPASFNYDMERIM